MITFLVVLALVLAFLALRAYFRNAAINRAIDIARRVEELREVNGPPVGKIKPAEFYERTGKLRAGEHEWCNQ